jgi:ABC-type branched-subunit amino acid transport system substrate-binding protein
MTSVRNHLQPLNGNKSIFRTISLIILIFISFQSVAQNPDCENFILHTVEKGQTVYGISKQYDISQEDLKYCNPEISEGLKIGLILKIPSKKGVKSKDAEQRKDGAYKIHIVKSKETLYGISKSNNTTVEEIIKLNPEAEAGLKVGMELKIPDTKKSKKQNDKTEELPIEAPVQEVLVKVEEEKPAAKPCKKVSEKEKSKIYNVALMLPFYANSSDKFNTKAKIGIDFYQGVKYALDSLKKQGVYVKLHVFDTQNDSAIAKSIIKKGSLDDMNLIIGPLYSALYMTVAEYANKKKIPSINPFVQSDITIRNNKYSIKATPDNATMASKVAKYVKEKYANHQVLFLTNSSDRDQEYTTLLKDALLESGVMFKPIKYVSFSEVAENLSESKENLVIFPSTAQAQVYDFTSKLNGHKSKKISLLGMSEWNNFENIDYNYLNNLNYFYAASNFTDYNSPASQAFQSAFRNEFKVEASNFAFQGFDIAWFFVNALYEYGDDFYKCLEQMPVYTGLNNSFVFRQKGKNNGFENQTIHIIKIDDFNAQIISRHE